MSPAFLAERYRPPGLTWKNPPQNRTLGVFAGYLLEGLWERPLRTDSFVFTHGCVFAGHLLETQPEAPGASTTARTGALCLGAATDARAGDFGATRANLGVVVAAVGGERAGGDGHDAALEPADVALGGVSWDLARAGHAASRPGSGLVASASSTPARDAVPAPCSRPRCQTRPRHQRLRANALMLLGFPLFAASFGRPLVVTPVRPGPGAISGRSQVRG